MNRKRTHFGRSLARTTSLPGVVLLLCSPGAYAAAHSFLASSPAATAYRALPRPTADVAVSGRVNDGKGEGLPGVSIIVKGTTIGTSTDAAGYFSMQVPEGSVLQFSFVGYAKQEYTVTGATSTLSIKLLDDTQMLDDIVVVGYGEQKKETVTGAIATVDQKIFRDRGVVDNPLAALQGQVPGVVVTRTSAAPGRSAWDFQIRGASSLSSTPPLVIIDGIAINDNNALNSLNPNDIESMSFLKDAAAAIYGARAGGGVVLVTTKTGKAGKLTIQYDGSVSQKRIGLQPHLISRQQFGQGLIDGVTNDFATTGALPTTNQWYRLGQTMVAGSPTGFIDLSNGGTTTPASNPANAGFTTVRDIPLFDTNWVDILWGRATSTQHNLSLSGRTDKAGYRVSLGYLNDGSLLQWGKNYNNRYNIRLTNDYEFSSKLRLDTNISLEKNDIVQPTLISNVLGQYQQSGFPASTINGKPYGWDTQLSPNWQAELGGENKEYNTRVYTNLKLTYDIVKNLRLVTQAGYNWSLQNSRIQQKAIQWYDYLEDFQYADNPTRTNTYFQEQNTRNSYTNLNAYLNYARVLNEAHDLSLTLGTSYERNEFNSVTGRVSNLINDEITSFSQGVGDATTRTNAQSQNHFAIGSYFGRFNYAFRQKYLFEANARYDGSSRFTPENRWRFFYGFSGGWRISEEAFLKDKVSFLNELKLRASYGVSGNQTGIGLYDYVRLLNIGYSTGPTSSGSPLLGAGPAVTVSPTSTLISLDRTWERIQNQNIGLDVAFLDRRLTASADYFVKHNRNMLLSQQLPATLGANAPAANAGHLKTWGWEATLNWQDRVGPVGYRIGGTVTDNRNELLDLQGRTVISQGYNASVQGYPIGSYFGLEYAGRIQSQDQLDTYKALLANNAIGAPTALLRVGDNMFRDLNGDGQLTTADYKYLGRDDPRYTFALNLGADWHGFDFNAIFQGVGSRTIFRSGNWRVPFGSIFQAQSDFWVGNTWTPTNPDAYYPILTTGQNGTGPLNTYNYQISDWSVENGAYVRLKNLVFGYTLPVALTQRVGVARLRVYYSGTDLWEKTSIRDGWDPEATRGVSSQERYPFFRLHTAGLNLTF